jgi:hypothetical protein
VHLAHLNCPIYLIETAPANVLALCQEKEYMLCYLLIHTLYAVKNTNKRGVLHTLFAQKKQNKSLHYSATSIISTILASFSPLPKHPFLHPLSICLKKTLVHSIDVTKIFLRSVDHYPGPKGTILRQAMLTSPSRLYADIRIDQLLLIDKELGTWIMSATVDRLSPSTFLSSVTTSFAWLRETALSRPSKRHCKSTFRLRA